jgi:hypothetical protein
MNMLRSILKTFILFIFGCLFMGCASAKLELELAIYTEDPFFVDLVSVTDIDHVKTDLNDISTKIQVLVDSRILLAQDMYDIYSQYYFITSKAVRAAKGKTYTPVDLDRELSSLKRYLNEFNEYIIDTGKLCKNNHETAIRWLDKYRKLIDKTSDGKQVSATEDVIKKSKILRTTQMVINDFQTSLKNLGGPSGTNFEKTLQAMWPRVFASMKSPQVQKWLADTKNKADLDDLTNRAAKVSADLTAVQKKGIEISQDLLNELAFVEKVNHVDQLDKLEAAFSKNNSMKISMDSKPFIEQMKKFDLLGSQVERLQDPSDPVWKIVTNPKNWEKWNVEFSRTFFRAKGNTSVVVVRDSPMEFRVQQGSNDPAALVQAQLQVSRAIADAAISVAGATTGVNLASLSKPDKRDSAQDTAVSNESEELARLKAKVTREAELRDLAIKRLSANLRSLRSQIEPLDTNRDKDMIERLLNNLVAALKADELIFTPEKENEE